MTKTRNSSVKVPTNTTLAINTSHHGITSTDTDDAGIPNPHGKVIVDCQEKRDKPKGRLAQANKLICIGTLNVRTIRLQHKQQELANIFCNVKNNILGIVDHKIVHEDEIEFNQYPQCKLITTTAVRNAAGAACGGVGIVISRAADDAMEDVSSYNQRILVSNFAGSPATTVIVHYAPVEGSDSAEEHYHNLADVINSVPKHNLLIVMGDFNAHIGTEDALFTYHETTNTNGQLMLDLAAETNLVITNTRFQKKRGKLWTYISDMSGTKTQIDYILVNKKWINSVKNVEAYNTFASLGSDHRTLTARIKLSLRTCKTPKGKPIYNWDKLKTDTDLQARYTVTVMNRYSSLLLPDDNATKKYQHFITANLEATHELIPVKEKPAKSMTSKNPRVNEARQNVQKSFDKYISDSSEENRIVLQSDKDHLKEAYDTVMEEEVDELVKRVEQADARYRHRESWKIINEISGRKSVKAGVLKGKCKEERIRNWHEHFSQLLGKPPEVDNVDQEIMPVLQDLQYLTGPFSMEEYQAAKKQIREGKKSGPDEIPPEVLKRCDFDETILEFANNLLINLDKPDQWSESNIIPLPKSGNMSVYDNYRGIALSAITAKLTNRMMLNRIQPVLDPHLRPNQNGFRPGRSTTAQILALRRILQGVRARNLPAVITFLDFKKAFDSIHRGKMLKILRAYGIPEELVNAIGKMYENTRARVITPDGPTEVFEILAGVLQGDTLAPFIFAIMIDYAMRQAISDQQEMLGFTIKARKSRRIPPIVISDLDFADDIALISDEIKQAQEFLTRVEIEAAKIGLHLNEKKTEFMAFNLPPTSDPVLKTRNGKSLKKVDDFKYLGGWLSSCEKDIKVRKGQAWAACHKLRKIWTSKLPHSKKISLFVALVESVLLYGSNTWTLTKSLEKSINGCYTRMLRMALNVSWKQHLTNETLYGKLPKVSSKIREARLRTAGHCIRHPEEEASKVVLWEPCRGTPNRGRKHFSYIDNLKRDTGLETTHDLKTVMMDRNIWREFVKSARENSRPR